MQFLPFLLLACAQPLPPTTAEAAGEPMEMRVYDVAPGVRDAVSRSLNNVLGKQGRALDGLEGSIVVVTTPTLHDGVNKLVTRVNKNPKLQGDKPESVRITYWIVSGKPAKKGSSTGLEALQPAVQAILEADGPQTLSLQHRRALDTKNGGEGSVDDDQVLIKQWVAARDGRVRANIKVRLRQQNAVMDTEISLLPDTFMVLAQMVSGDENLYVVARPSFR